MKKKAGFMRIDISHAAFEVETNFFVFCIKLIKLNNNESIFYWTQILFYNSVPNLKENSQKRLDFLIV